MNKRNISCFFGISVSAYRLATLLGVVSTLALGSLKAQDPVAEAPDPKSDAQEVTDDQTSGQTQDEADKIKKQERELVHFLRVRRDAKRRPQAMETSVTRYLMTNEQGEKISVDLIGVVHIGEKDYYEALNKQFEQYDSMLYELVAPEEANVPMSGERDGLNPIAALQKGMQSLLGLEFQLDHIDYTKPNFTHADMSPDEFLKSMKNNDESIAKYVLKAVGQSMAMQGSSSGMEVELLMSFFSKDKELRMRRLLADQFLDMESGMVIFEGKDGSTIIDHRNAKCMQVLRSEIDAGKKKLAIFYGAGHLPDMQRRLISDFKMKRAGQFWLTAWELTDQD